ncbi:MAG TPA: hypothetical protein VFR11_00245 [Micromonosporaceae bacterium]|nr:hypothetical protein [Micromonosporaceae bacterium]
MTSVVVNVCGVSAGDVLSASGVLSASAGDLSSAFAVAESSATRIT